jgi:hypothetical protein
MSRPSSHIWTSLSMEIPSSADRSVQVGMSTMRLKRTAVSGLQEVQTGPQLILNPKGAQPVLQWESS